MKVGTFGFFVVCAQAASDRDGKWLAVFRIDRQTPDLLRTDVVEREQHVDGLTFDTDVQAVQAAFEAALIRLRHWQQAGNGETPDLNEDWRLASPGARHATSPRKRLTPDSRVKGHA
jgi:hypothetical protein